MFLIVAPARMGAGLGRLLVQQKGVQKASWERDRTLLE